MRRHSRKVSALPSRRRKIIRGGEHVCISRMPAVRFAPNSAVRINSRAVNHGFRPASRAGVQPKRHGVAMSAGAGIGQIPKR